MARLPRLRTIDFSDSRQPLSLTAVFHLARCVALSDVNMSGCSDTALDLSQCWQLQDSDLAVLPHFPHLRSLRIAELYDITDAAFATIARVPLVREPMQSTCRVL
jgi:hypothetical protein